MAAQTVEISGLGDKAAELLLNSHGVVTFTRDGKTVGTFIPAKPTLQDLPTKPARRSAAWEEFIRTTDAIHREMEELGITEEDIVAEFERLRDEGRAATQPR